MTSENRAVPTDREPPPGTELGFAFWVQPHLGALGALAVRAVGRADAEDVVQETLARAWLRRSTYDPSAGPPRAWLIGILNDRCRRLRLHQLRRTRPLPDEQLSPGLEVPARLDLERAVGRLPRRQRQVIELHYIADFALADIAGVLGITLGTVKSTLFDARANLRDYLKDDHGDR